jgi:hypothetical protein
MFYIIELELKGVEIMESSQLIGGICAAGLIYIVLGIGFTLSNENKGYALLLWLFGGLLVGFIGFTWLVVQSVFLPFILGFLLWGGGIYWLIARLRRARFYYWQDRDEGLEDILHPQDEHVSRSVPIIIKGKRIIT